MSGMQASGVGAAGCSSALPHQQKQEVTVAGFSDEAVAKIIKAYNDSQKMEQAELDHQQQQEVTAAGFSQKMEQAELDHNRGWLMALATLIASVTYAAALSPPGGFWGADDKANGYVAGTPVFRDKFPSRYKVFYLCNALSFATSLSIIVTLSNRKPSSVLSNRTDKIFLIVMVFMDFICLAGALVAGSTTDARLSVRIAVLMVLIVLLYPLRMLQSSIGRGNGGASN